MKKKLLKVLVAAVLVSSLVLLVACKENQPSKESLNQNEAAAPTVKSGESVKINPDAAIDIALDHAGVSREDAIMLRTPSLDKEKGKTHYDVEFGHDGIEYDYEVAVDDGSVIKVEKEAEKFIEPEAPKKPVQENEKPPVNNEQKGDYISVEVAKQKALENAGVKAEDAKFLKAYYDADDRVPHYEIKFFAKGYEYEYEIKAADGMVLEKDVDKEKEPVKAPVEVEKPTSSNSGYISVDVAKEKALENAGVKAENAKFLKAYYDSDDLVPHFDIKFVADGYEYEYEIKAADGMILEKDVERERVVSDPEVNAEKFISENEAKEIAYSHASVSAENVKFAKAELDIDDIVAHYDVEFVEGKYEYEYEINAETGKIIASEKDFHD